MRKTILAFFALFLFGGMCSSLRAQSTFTADLELIFRDTARYFVIEAGDSLNLGFAVVNHGPDDVDTNSFVFFSMTGIPPQYFLIIQGENGLVPLPNGDTVDSHGIRFTNDGTLAEDQLDNLCFYLRTNDDPDSFVYDPNQNNDTICFQVLWKAGDTTTSIRKLTADATLQLSPNPTSDYVDVPLKNLKGQEALISVTGIDGRSVYAEKTGNINAASHRLNVASWPKGMYVVTVQTDKVRRTGRFVVL